MCTHTHTRVRPCVRVHTPRRDCVCVCACIGVCARVCWCGGCSPDPAHGAPQPQWMAVVRGIGRPGHSVSRRLRLRALTLFVCVQARAGALSPSLARAHTPPRAARDGVASNCRPHTAMHACAHTLAPTNPYMAMPAHTPHTSPCARPVCAPAHAQRACARTHTHVCVCV